MKLLAIDTSGRLSSACIWDSEQEIMLASDSQDIGRGHAEILMPQIHNCLEQADMTPGDIDRIVVSIGPGSFTGVRVGIASARSMSLALKKPLVGVSTFQAAKCHAKQLGAVEPVTVLLNANRGQAYVQFGDDEAVIESLEALAGRVKQTHSTLCGSAAGEICQMAGIEREIAHHDEVFSIEIYAYLGGESAPSVKPPEPLYLRTADAKTQKGFALPRK